MGDYYVHLPDGSYLHVPDGISTDQVKAKISAKFPDAYPQTAPGTVTGNVANIGAGRVDTGAPSRLVRNNPSTVFPLNLNRTTDRIAQNMENFAGMVRHPIDTISGMLSSKTPPIDAALDQYSKDPNTAAGDALTAILSKTIGGEPVGANMAEASGSSMVPKILSRPIGTIRAGLEAAQPDAISLLKRPIGTMLEKAPAGINAMRGSTRIQPVPRPVPAWQNLPENLSSGSEVESILNRAPSSTGPGRKIFPAKSKPENLPDTVEGGPTPYELREQRIQDEISSKLRRKDIQDDFAVKQGIESKLKKKDKGQ